MDLRQDFTAPQSWRKLGNKLRDESGSEYAAEAFRKFLSADVVAVPDVSGAFGAILGPFEAVLTSRQLSQSL